MNNINPSFSKYYGSVNGICNKYHYDITEEYDEFKNEKWFYKNLGELFSIDMYVDESEDESEGSYKSTKSSKSSKSLKSCKSTKSSKSSIKLKGV